MQPRTKCLLLALLCDYSIASALVEASVFYDSEMDPKECGQVADLLRMTGSFDVEDFRARAGEGRRALMALLDLDDAQLAVVRACCVTQKH